MNVDLDYIVAAIVISSAIAGVGWKLGAIGLGILDRMGALEKKVDVLITEMKNTEQRMSRIEARIDRLESRIERLEGVNQ